MRRAAPSLLAALVLALDASAANPFAGAASGSEVSAEGVVHNVSILSDGRVAFDVRGEAASRRFRPAKNDIIRLW